MGQEFFGDIKADSGVKKIKVNDAGEYIELSLTDVTLFERFTGLLDWFEIKQAELNQSLAKGAAGRYLEISFLTSCRLWTFLSR